MQFARTVTHITLQEVFKFNVFLCTVIHNKEKWRTKDVAWWLFAPWTGIPTQFCEGKAFYCITKDFTSFAPSSGSVLFCSSFELLFEYQWLKVRYAIDSFENCIKLDHLYHGECIYRDIWGLF